MSWKSQQDTGPEWRRLWILAGVSKCFLYSHYKRQFAWSLLQTPILRLLFAAVTSSFPPRKRQHCGLILCQTHQRNSCIPALHLPLISLDPSGTWESPFVNPVCALPFVIWEAPAYLKMMASFVFPSSYWITCWCTSDIPSTGLMKAPFFFVQVVLRQKSLHTHTSSSYLIDVLRHHAWNMPLFMYLCL